MSSYFILALIVSLTIVGDFALKHASMTRSPFISPWFVGGALLYATTAIGWTALMNSHNLAQIAVLYSAATIFALTLLGVGYFSETLSAKQIVGLAAAFLSVVLVNIEA